MGGPGSTRWECHQTKRTVEKAVTLDIGSLSRQSVLVSGASGTFRWGGFTVAWRTEVQAEGCLELNLRYCRHSGEEIVLPLTITATLLFHGGLRYWFQCPAIGCQHARVSKLYLLPYGKYFACRQCHRLVYRSSQQSRKYAVSKMKKAR